MSYEFVLCLDCDEEVEVLFDGDNASMCPECRSMDNFDEIEPEICGNCNGSGEGYVEFSRCTKCKGKGVLK